MELQKIKIVSNNMGFFMPTFEDEEVEQHLTINAAGRVWFSGYDIVYGIDKFVRKRRRNFSIGKEAAAIILSAVGKHFDDWYIPLFATDIGSFEMNVTYKDGMVKKFDGSLFGEIIVDGIDLSDLIRDTLNMPDLFVFDGEGKTDTVEKITLNYYRVTNIGPTKDSCSDLSPISKGDYSEQLIIDRETDTIDHIQRISSDCVISHKYYVKEGVRWLLDSLDADSLFDYIVGNDPDVITDTDDTKDYEFTVDFQKRPQLIISGSFDKNGLPDDWPEFAESIQNFIRSYGNGEILDPFIYKKTRRKTNEYIFCSVEFSRGGGKSYYYLTDDDTLETGDYVLIPIGSNGHTSNAKIVDIEYFDKDNVPFPLDKVKRIIRKCTDDDFAPQVLFNENEDSQISEVKETATKSDNFYCPVYDGYISEYDCCEICCGAIDGRIPNDGIPELMDIKVITERRQWCLDCVRNTWAQREAQIFREERAKFEKKPGDRIKVSDIVDYRFWTDYNGNTVSVSVDFETADDFHYDLEMEAWHKFQTKVLKVTNSSINTTTTTEAFKEFFENNTDLFDFEEALKCNGIPYGKTVFD